MVARWPLCGGSRGPVSGKRGIGALLRVARPCQAESHQVFCAAPHGTQTERSGPVLSNALQAQPPSTPRCCRRRRSHAREIVCISAQGCAGARSTNGLQPAVQDGFRGCHHQLHPHLRHGTGSLFPPAPPPHPSCFDRLQWWHLALKAAHVVQSQLRHCLLYDDDDAPDEDALHVRQRHSL